MRQLGTLSFFFFWVVSASGIYIYIFFETSVSGAYDSIEVMTNDQWYMAGVMRSLHRYASDAMVLLTAIHLTREFVFDRYRGSRWFAWFTGVPTLWFLYLAGISGYWLVWDQLAQYVAIGSMEWLDWLGIFGKPIANNFLAEGSLGDRFFSLLVFIHIFVPLFLLFIMWIHVLRVTQPKINPPRGLAVGAFLMMVVFSLIRPAVSQAPANLDIVPGALDLDWYYMLFYPLFDNLGAGSLWGIAIGLSFIVGVMPWLPPLRRAKAAIVVLDKCNGCTRCYDDCPFGAIRMEPRSDGKPFEQEAVVNPSACTSCGICVGACPMSMPFRSGELVTAIDLPDLPLDRVRKLTQEAMEKSAKEAGEEKDRVVVFSCSHGAGLKSIKKVEGVSGVSLPCIGMLPPSFIDYTLSRGEVDGVVLTGCRECGCHQRLGNRWMRQRLEGKRDPYLRKRVPTERIKVVWASKVEGDLLAEELADFRKSLRCVDKNSEEGA